jgi:uncharacterized oligopeptide transporter (OPT) family protein
MSEIESPYEPPREIQPPNKGTGAAIGFLFLTLVLATLSAVIGLALKGPQIAELNRQRIAAGQPPLDSATKSGMLLGYVTPNYFVPFVVAGLFAIARKYRNRRSFAKIAMITSIVIFVSALGNLGRNQSARPARGENFQKPGQMREVTPRPD